MKGGVTSLNSAEKKPGTFAVEIIETQQEIFHQKGRGRPSANTKYQRETKSRFALHRLVSGRVCV